MYYAVSVIIAMASIGFSIGGSIMLALDVDWTWLVILVAGASGTLLAMLAIVVDLPSVVLIGTLDNTHLTTKKVARSAHALVDVDK